MWFVYILESLNGAYYTGVTNDLEKRMNAHAAGKGAKFTRGFGFKKLLYQERFCSKSKAYIREAAIKKLSRPAKQSLMKNRGRR